MAKYRKKNEYLQIYLGSRAVPVTAVAVQGRSSNNQYVSRFTLHFSNDTKQWKNYTENGEEKVG